VPAGYKKCDRSSCRYTCTANSKGRGCLSKQSGDAYGHAPGGVYQWWDALTGGNFLGSGATYVTPPINASTAFYVETTIGAAPARGHLSSL